MSKRLQVVVDDDELAEVQRAAGRSRMTSSEWVRQALRRARQAEPEGDPGKKLAIVRRAAAHAYPTSDIHRYVAIERCDAIQPAFDALLGVVDEVLPVTADDVQRAKTIVLGQGGLSARDALHAAVMERAEVTRIMSFDRGFDQVPGLSRLHR